MSKNNNKKLHINTPVKIALFIKLIIQMTILGCLISVNSISFSQNDSNNESRFSVIEVITSTKENNKLQLLSQFQLSLSATAYDAIDHGVPIDIVIQFAKPQSRLWGTQYKELDKTVFRLTRYALSNNYQLENISAFETIQFITIDEALKHIATFQINQVRNDDIDKIAVRVYLDIFNLPAQIRASAFFSDRWHHDSDWTVWEVS